VVRRAVAAAGDRMMDGAGVGRRVSDPPCEKCRKLGSRPCSTPTTRMSFRLVPKSVTLNDLERRNGPYFALFLLNLVVSGRIA